MSDDTGIDADTNDATEKTPLTRWQRARLLLWRCRRVIYELSFPAAMIIGAWATMLGVSGGLAPMLAPWVPTLWQLVGTFILTMCAMFFLWNCLMSALLQMKTPARLYRFFLTFRMLSESALRNGCTYRSYGRLQERLIRDEAMWSTLEKDKRPGRWVMTGISLGEAPSENATPPPPPRRHETWCGRGHGAPSPNREETREGSPESPEE